MARVVSIGRQDFEKMRIRNNFYIDKTHFIRLSFANVKAANYKDAVTCMMIGISLQGP